MSTASITNQALELPLRERVAVAQALWASIDGQLEDTQVASAVQVARERDAEFDAGTVSGESHDAVMGRARRSLE